MLYQLLNINTLGHLVKCKAWLLFWYTHVLLNFLFLLIDSMIETFRRERRWKNGVIHIVFVCEYDQSYDPERHHNTMPGFCDVHFFVNLHKIFWNSAIDFEFDKATRSTRYHERKRLFRNCNDTWIQNN